MHFHRLVDAERAALTNIVTNAQEAMPGGGCISIDCANIPEAPPPEQIGVQIIKGPYVRISVRDHGIGIPKEHLERIFDPYYSTKERGSQKGMGLTVVHSILKKHDGYVTVESEIDEGSVFHIYLPAATGDENIQEVRHDRSRNSQ